MATESFPSVRRRRLGAELRRMREAKNLTCEDVGNELDCHYSKISRIENAQSGVRRLDLRAMLDLYGIEDPEHRDALEKLAVESRKRGWWQKYGDVVPPAYADYISLEADAVKMRSFNIALAPGLLQTPEYARAVIAGTWRTNGPDEVDTLVNVRLERQKRLTGADAVELRVIMAENAIRQSIGGSEVMRGQLEYLLEAAQLPNVMLSVLPDDAGANPGLHGSFVVLGFRALGDLDVVLVEHLTSSLYLENQDEIDWYQWAFESTLASANSPARSLSMIKEAIRNLR